MAKRSADGLFKRGNVWWGWRRLFPGGPLHRASTRVRDRQAARLVKAEWERSAADPVHYASNKTTLAEGIVMFLDDSKHAKLAPPTLEMYASKCRHIARVLDQDRPLRSIVATTWDGYIKAREAEGAHPHTIKKELIRGFGVLKAAKRRGLYPHDLSTIMPRYSAAYEPRTRALTLEELQKLGAQLRADRLAHVAFVVATGCRLKESYRAREGHMLAEGYVYIDGTKTKRAKRTIPIAPPLRGFLEFAVRNAPGAKELTDGGAEEERGHVGGRVAARDGTRAGSDHAGLPGNRAGGGAGPVHDAPEFGRGDEGAGGGRRGGDDGGLPGPERVRAVALFPRWHSARRDIHAACKRAGIEPCSWNDLRRTNATLLDHAGMTSVDIGKLLGHVDGRMVETVYGQSTPASLARALEAAFANGTPTAHIDIQPRALPVKKADSATEMPGLRSRRSEVRILCGAPEKPSNSVDGESRAGVEASTETVEAAASPFTNSTVDDRDLKPDKWDLAAAFARVMRRGAVALVALALLGGCDEDAGAIASCGHACAQQGTAMRKYSKTDGCICGPVADGGSP